MFIKSFFFFFGKKYLNKLFSDLPKNMIFFVKILIVQNSTNMY